MNNDFCRLRRNSLFFALIIVVVFCKCFGCIFLYLFIFCDFMIFFVVFIIFLMNIFDIFVNMINSFALSVISFVVLNNFCNIVLFRLFL